LQQLDDGARACEVMRHHRASGVPPEGAAANLGVFIPAPCRRTPIVAHA